MCMYTITYVHSYYSCVHTSTSTVLVHDANHTHACVYTYQNKANQAALNNILISFIEIHVTAILIEVQYGYAYNEQTMCNLA